LGGALPVDARIAVVANDAIGNFVVATPLLQMLRATFAPCAIHYYGGNRTSELESASDLMDARFPLHGSSVQDSARHILASVAEGRPYHLVVNNEWTPFAKAMTALLSGPDTWVVGPCLNESRGDLPFADDEVGRLAADEHWVSESLTERFPFLSSAFIGEIFCRLAYLKGPIPAYRVPQDAPTCAACEVVIAPSASLPEKLWPAAKWLETLRWLRAKGVSVGLVGAKPGDQKHFWKGSDVEESLLAEDLAIDLRGSMTLPQVVGLLDQAKVALGVDNGILHLAAATKAETVGLFRRGIHRLWASPSPRLSVLTHGEGETVADIPLDCVKECLLNAI